MFVLHVNPMTSRSEWRMQAEDYDYQQEVARAAFADMLHDSERVSQSQPLSSFEATESFQFIINLLYFLDCVHCGYFIFYWDTGSI